MKTWKLTFVALIASAAFAGQASAVTFTDLNSGVNITINDSIWNSTYSGGSPALNTGSEDNETERLQDGRNTYTGQKWDFEGMFLNSQTGVITLIAGWDFAQGVVYGGSRIQVGDLFIGDWNNTQYKNNNTVVAQGYTPTTVLDFSRDSDGSLSGNGTYRKITGGFTTNSTTDLTPLSDPYTYNNGGTASSNNYTYNIGTVTDTPFSGWDDSDVSGDLLNNNHYFMQIFGLEGTAVYDNVLHITLACGNDVGRGQTSTPVPEPTTLVLLGAGLLGIGLVRRRIRK